MSLEKIQHIIKYIEENYNRDISIQKLEQLSNYSYRNVQRVFKNIFHESLGTFQKRLKLENAYKKLIYTRDPITDISYSVGFDSLQSFSKSFKKQFNVSPIKARKERKVIFESFINNYPEKNKSIDYEIVFLKKIKVFYIGIQTKNYNNTEIELLWDKIDTVFAKNTTSAYFGIIVDQPLITDKLKCRYEACIDKDPVNKDFSSTYILGCRYAKYIHKGSYSLIEDTYRRIYIDWLFNSALEFDSSPIIEHYIKNEIRAENVHDYITEILIPIKKK
ncbi:AraC family transcriptional regulator [Mucilaginibacter lappiensis]|uniref:AraC family transcriptional regulator n=1 Tax=Mucilaginibacter lappiensis TaxID=354630 RepID=A0A1N6WK75_9SPHI|nr:AraC family transcriptional regulator [Mucilaginibacter lappiensis]MBB6109567.1 AraC family transcriptional regulator [Mucilaginibacter lappiensis]MBB6127803.1 AraC family transcriptional regulator [Mucilaginibacter lappiensis]SIQ90400.1 transcriptional regulator, AraC family [Mucilaginibacter lappiensis]